MNRIILFFLASFIVGCGQGSDRRDHELVYCGTAPDKAGCQALGCDVGISGSMGRAEENRCTLEPEPAQICFLDRGKKPVMDWGNVITTYVRERQDGGFDIMTLNSLYDEALPDWHSCLSDGNLSQCSVCGS